MQSEMTKRQADLIVVGSGVAGLAAALAAGDAGAEVLLLTSGEPLAGSSPHAQGGIAAALGSDDSPALHFADTLAVGAGLNDRRAVEILVSAGRREMQALLDGIVRFDGSPGSPDLGLEAGHQRRRIVHANGAATGHAVTSALLARAAGHRRISLLPNSPVDRLLTAGERVVGAVSGAAAHSGRAVVLATGGYAGLFARTTNPPECRGQGQMLAWHAGAALADLEFVQFHPTALALPNHPAYLLSEALRGEGALVVDDAGLPIVDPLLPRDQLARAIFAHQREHGPVFLTLLHLDPAFVRLRFSAQMGQLAAWGVDITRDLLPIAPAAHYCMGGVRTDESGRTDVPGLYAAGEVACTGAQGANRLASNSLLECLVFGRLAAQAALEDTQAARASWQVSDLPDEEADAGYTAARPSPGLSISGGLGAALDHALGVERTGDDLQQLLGSLKTENPGAALVPSLAAHAALRRRESRGAHYRGDFPLSDPRWEGRILWSRGAAPRFERIH